MVGWQVREDKVAEQRLAEWHAGAEQRTLVSRALVQSVAEWLESDPATRVSWEWRAVPLGEQQMIARYDAEEGGCGRDAAPLMEAGWP